MWIVSVFSAFTNNKQMSQHVRWWQMLKKGRKQGSGLEGVVVEELLLWQMIGEEPWGKVTLQVSPDWRQGASPEFWGQRTQGWRPQGGWECAQSVWKHKMASVTAMDSSMGVMLGHEAGEEVGARYVLLCWPSWVSVYRILRWAWAEGNSITLTDVLQIDCCGARVEVGHQFSGDRQTCSNR